MKVLLRAGGERLTLLDTKLTKKIIERFEDQLDSDGAVPYAINLSCRSWGTDALKVFIDLVEKRNIAKTTQVLILDDIIANRETEEGLAVMESLAKTFAESPLVELALSENALGERAMTRLTPLFQGHSLKRIYLNDCGLSLAAMETLRDAALGNEKKLASSLEEIVLDQNMIGPDGAVVIGEFLKECKNLQLFSFQGCRQRAEGTRAICQAFEELTRGKESKLRHIEMDDGTLGSDDDSAVVPFCRALERSPLLTCLKNTDGGLEAEGMKRVADALQKSGAMLTHLHLEANELGPEGGQIVGNLMRAMSSSIRILNLDTNELGDEGVCALMEPFAAARSTLEDLSLNGNEIEADGAKAILQSTLPNLKQLSLTDNLDMPNKDFKDRFAAAVVNVDDDVAVDKLTSMFAAL